MTTLPFLLWALSPFVIFDSDNPLISCLLCKSKDLRNIFMILGTTVEQDQMTCPVQEWQRCLSYLGQNDSVWPIFHSSVILPINWKTLMEKFHTTNLSSIWCNDRPKNISRSVFLVTHRFALKFIKGCVIYIQTHKTYCTCIWNRII